MGNRVRIASRYNAPSSTPLSRNYSAPAGTPVPVPTFSHYEREGLAQQRYVKSLEPSFRSRPLVFCMDITAVDSNDQRCGRIRKLIPVSLAATNEHVVLFTQFVF